MKYLFAVLGSAAVTLGAVGMLNWTVDPASIFGKNRFGLQYVEALQASKNGVSAPPSLDERIFKAEMARGSVSHDCIVVGSSHVMQIGSERTHRSFSDCKSILNLGVSGAGLEDQIALTWLAASTNKPRFLFLGIDPWTLAFDKDERWQIRYPNEYQQARTDIGASPRTSLNDSSRWSNLIGAEYTLRSLQSLRSGGAISTILEAPPVDDEIGTKFPVTLRDGSHVYASDYIAKIKNTPVMLGGEPYKVSKPLNEANAILDFKKLLTWLQQRGVQPVLLMTPYHPNVWKSENSPNTQAMEATEKILLLIGRDLNIRILGSYRPDVIGCSSNEFFDFMHPLPSCLGKIKFRQN